MNAPTKTPLINRWTLQFLGHELEQAYRDAHFARSRVVFRAALALSIVIHATFMFVDHWVLGVAAPLMWKLRLLLLIPTSGIVLLLSSHPKFQRIEQPATAVAVVINIAVMIVGGLAFDDSIAYFSSGTVMVMIFGYILLGLRFSWCAPLLTLCTALHVFVLLYQEGLAVGDQVVAIEVLVLSVFSLTIGAYRMELLSRTQYHTMEQLLTQERREREWLGLITGFVRHELKNSIAGIGSSLQLVADASIDSKRDEYVSRASKSLQFMRRFLEKVGAATDLENALRRQDSALLSLSELVAGCVEDAHMRAEAREFQRDIAADVRVRGNADSLVQMIDKLLNNAIEHSNDNSRIVVRLAVADALACLEIANLGDTLPQDTERLFRPFVSTKAGSTNGNLGLGLYVARTIAVFHGGNVLARPLTNPDGACFVVTLPVGAEPT